MHQESIREFALSLDDVEESLPFGPDVLVFKTDGKIFLLLPLDTPDVRCNVKCDPEEAIQQRENWPEQVLPGYHMNKQHWNTLIIDGVLSDQFVKDRITDSYLLIRQKKTRSSKRK